MQDQIIQKILDYLEQTEDFVLEHLPDVIVQALRYERIISVLGVILLSFLFSCAVYVGYHCWTNPRLDKYGSWETISVLGVIIPCSFAPLLLVQLCFAVDKLIKIYVAPKYFLVQLFLSIKG